MTKLPFKLLQIVVPIAVFIFCLLAVTPYAATRKASFDAQARVWIQAQIPTMNGEQQDNAGIYVPFMSFFNSPLLTAAEILKSGEVMTCASELLKERGQKVLPPSEIAYSLSSQPIKDTDILLVKFSNANPKVAAAALQAVLDAFVKVSSTQSSASATKGRAYLESELKETQAELDDVSSKLAVFQKQHNVSNMEHDTKLLIDAVQRLRETVKEDQIRVAKHQRAINLLQSEAASVPAAVESAKNDMLHQRLVEQNVKLSQARLQLPDEHPYVQQLNDHIEQLKKQVKPAMGVVPRSVIEGQILEQRKELLQVESEYSGHTANLQKMEQRIGKLPLEQIEWSELNRRKDLASARVDALQRRLQSATLLETVAAGTTNIKVIDKPEVPTMPSGPSKMVAYAVAGVVGLVLAGASFIALRQFNPVITSVAQLLVLAGWPVAGVMGFGERAKQSQIELIRRALKRLGGTAKRVVVFGADPGEGRSHLASALALSLAQSGSRVVLVDGAKNGSTLHKRFNVERGPGLSDYLQSPTINPVRKVANNLVLLTSGNQSSPSSLFEQQSVQSLMDDLARQVDYIVFDTAATSEDSEALLLLEKDAVGLFTIRLGSTRKSAVAGLSRQLGEIPGLKGLVVVTDASEEDLGAAVLTPTFSTASTGVAPQAAEVEQPVW